MGANVGWRAGGFVAGLVCGALIVTTVPKKPSGPDIHAEYVKFLSGQDSITGYLAYPERSTPGPAIVMIHEIFGMSDFVRESAERLAKEGFVVLAPDLLSRRGGTPASADSARRLIASLNPDTLTKDLDAAVAYVRGLKSVKADRIGVIGFCWGGGESFRYATNNASIKAFVVCYGPRPNLADISRIRAAGLGIYADKDVRINSDLYDVTMWTAKNHVEYEFKVYPGVGHGFLRTAEKPKVVAQAWDNVTKFFRRVLGT